MNGFVANTDFDWFTTLAAGTHDEVNFWRPSGRVGFKALAPGEPLFFRLKAPHRAIAGFGLFARYVRLPDWLAWETFGEANGARTRSVFDARIGRYRAADAPASIGCILLSDPVFFPRELWVDQPAGWSDRTVTGKGFDLTAGEGRRIWRDCLARASVVRPTVAAEAPRWGDPTPTRPRLGQRIFRAAVTDAYDGACAVTTEHSLPALEAAHIVPYAEGGEHAVSNGLLLRSDIHRLFDRGYVTVTDDLRFAVSRRLHRDFDNGRTYYALEDRPLHLPRDRADRPDPAALQWHRESVFLG